MRVVRGEGRNDSGGFAPVDRPRLVERLSAAARYPITLLAAPAGYGKSVVLRQYLQTLRGPCVRFALRSEHATLLGFLRGFAEALRDHAPHAITALAGAYERTTPSSRRSTELARWLHAHLESFNGVIAIDDLHAADGDAEVAAFLTSLIEATKSQIRWILASRNATDLPLGTWFAYRDADVPVDDEVLRFTPEELRSAANALSLTTRDEELNDLLALTEGWPAAISFALRTSTRSSDLRNVSAMTRDMIYRFLAEQVYSTLDADERALLEVAIALPTIDVTVLERAGFDRALPIVEQLRNRTAFIYEESAGSYQCHELFRDFLRHQSALGGRRSQQQVHERAARALEGSGDVEHAIAAYALAGCPDEVVRLLEHHGFDLLERARGDVVARAIDSLDATRRENAAILALHGALQAVAGKFGRAETLLRRSLARAGTNRALVAMTSLRLAAILGNQGEDVTVLLDPVASDSGQMAAYRAEALSLIAARKAIAGERAIPQQYIGQVRALLPQIESDVTRAKLLHHLGIASRHIGDIAGAFLALTESSDLATELHLYNVGSRANSVLSNLALHEEDDVVQQLKYAELASVAATKAGDAFALQTALLQILSAYIRRADIDKAVEVERRFSALRTDSSAERYLALSKSVRLAWEGRFREAHRLIASRWAKMHFDFDRASCGSQCALFLALDGHREESTRLISKIIPLVSEIQKSGLFRRRCAAISTMFCALAETINGRSTKAERMLRTIATSDAVINDVQRIANNVVRAGRGTAATAENINNINSLTSAGYGDVARLLRVVCDKIQSKGKLPQSSVLLTASEREILQLLAQGQKPKDIAIDTTRSVHTVRVHIANAIEKLECHGTSQAVAQARRLELIEG